MKVSAANGRQMQSPAAATTTKVNPGNTAVMDQREETLAQLQLQSNINNSSRVEQQVALRDSINNSSLAIKQRQHVNQLFQSNKTTSLPNQAPPHIASQRVEQEVTEEEKLGNEDDEYPGADYSVDLELDMNNDGDAEPHKLLVEKNTGEIILHSDPQTLKNFLKYRKNQTFQDLGIVAQIKTEAAIVHTGRYGDKGKAPTVAQKNLVTKALNKIAALLQQLSTPEYRPPSHMDTKEVETINGEKFAKKLKVTPLSLLPRDDGITGSIPYQETKLWRSLTNFAGYKRGHMLNAHLHGPGSNDNLVPISTAFNSVMRDGVEKKMKQAVNAENKVISYEAEAKDWGSFPGAFGFLEEKKLPNTFFFKVTEMQKLTGTKGDDRAHWVNTSNVLYNQTLTHNIPTDTISGVIAPTIKTFEPGLYRHPGGSIKFANPNYHVKGSFSVNGIFPSSVIDALGVDDKNTLKPSFIYETVLHEYKLPNGYAYKKIANSTTVEYLYFGKICDYDFGDSAFIIYNVNKHNSLLQSHKEEINNFKKQEELAKKEKLSQQEQQRLESIKRINEIKQQEEERANELERQKKLELDSEKFRHQLYGTVRNEVNAKGYVEEFGKEFIEENESILRLHRARWKADKHFIDKSMDELLQPVWDEIEELAAKLTQNREDKDEVMQKTGASIELEVAQLMELLNSAEAKDEFKNNAQEECNSFIIRWQSRPLLSFDQGEFSDSEKRLIGRLKDNMKKASEWDGKNRTEKLKKRLSKDAYKVVENYCSELSIYRKKFFTKAKETIERHLQEIDKSDKTIDKISKSLMEKLAHYFQITLASEKPGRRKSSSRDPEQKRLNRRDSERDRESDKNDFRRDRSKGEGSSDSKNAKKRKFDILESVSTGGNQTQLPDDRPNKMSKKTSGLENPVDITDDQEGKYEEQESAIETGMHGIMYDETDLPIETEMEGIVNNEIVNPNGVEWQGDMHDETEDSIDIQQQIIS